MRGLEPVQIPVQVLVLSEDRLFNVSDISTRVRKYNRYRVLSGDKQHPYSKVHLLKLSAVQHIRDSDRCPYPFSRYVHFKVGNAFRRNSYGSAEALD